MKKLLLLFIIVLLISGCATEQECYEDYKDNQIFDNWNSFCNREPSKCKYHCEKLDLEYYTYDSDWGTDCFCLNEGLPIQVY